MAMVGQSSAQRFAGLLTNVVLARALGVTGFGVYSVVATTSSSMFGILRLGSEWAILVQTAGPDTDRAKRSHGELLGAGLLLLLLAGCAGLAGCLAFADRIAQGLFGDGSLAVWIRAAGVSTLLLCLSQFCSAALAGLERFTSYAKVIATMAILQVAVGAGGALFGLRGAVIAAIAVQAMTAAAMAAVVRRALKGADIQIAFRNLYASTRQLLKFGVPFHAAALVWIPVSYYLQATLARYAGVDALGYLRVVTSVTMLVTFVPGSLATTVAVMLSGATHPRHFAAESMRLLKLVSLCCVHIALLVSLALRWLVPVVFGSAYGPIVGAASLALTSSVLLAIASPIEATLLSARRPIAVLIMTLVRMLTFLAAGQFLIAPYGLTGYLIADLVGHALMLTVVYCSSRRWLRENLVAQGWLARVLVLWFLLLGFSVAALARGGAHPAGAIVLGIVVMIGICVWTYRTILDRTERDALNRIRQPRMFWNTLTAATTD
jgi:O-antigen/teichoic acid export membrane protein